MGLAYGECCPWSTSGLGLQTCQAPEEEAQKHRLFLTFPPPNSGLVALHRCLFSHLLGPGQGLRERAALRKDKSGCDKIRKLKMVTEDVDWSQSTHGIFHKQDWPHFGPNERGQGAD
jgi:hypothetical protein